MNIFYYQLFPMLFLCPLISFAPSCCFLLLFLFLIPPVFISVSFSLFLFHYVSVSDCCFCFIFWRLLFLFSYYFDCCFCFRLFFFRIFSTVVFVFVRVFSTVVSVSDCCFRIVFYCFCLHYFFLLGCRPMPFIGDC